MNEKIILAEIYKQNGEISFNVPNEKDVYAFELYGFLKIFVEKLEKELKETLRND